MSRSLDSPRVAKHTNYFQQSVHDLFSFSFHFQRGGGGGSGGGGGWGGGGVAGNHRRNQGYPGVFSPGTF